MARLAFGTALCQTGDGYRLASRGLSPLLGMEESVLRRSPDGISGSSESHPAHEPRQPSLGSSSHLWGTPDCCSSSKHSTAILCQSLHESREDVRVPQRKKPSQSFALGFIGGLLPPLEIRV